MSSSQQTPVTPKFAPETKGFFASRGTSLPVELQAGFTTFASMAYILAVNPAMLSATGMDKAALVSSTAITAALSTLLMALLANLPIALAPGMGINAFFAFTICLGKGVPWSEALGMVFVNGVIFLLLSLTGVRERIFQAIPQSLKIAITCGIGLFITFIGLKNGGVVAASPATFITHGEFTDPAVALCLGGLLLTICLVALRVPGAIILGIIGISTVGLFVHGANGTAITQLPGSIVSTPASLSPVFFKLSFNFLSTMQGFLNALPLILTLLLVDMFDNIGTLVAVTKRAGLLDKEGRLPKAGRALVADSTATILSALFGTSTVVSYIESAAGVEAGGRTGVTGVVVAVCMLLALFLTPLIIAIPAVATAPALIVVGVFMLQSVTEIDMADFGTAAPAALTIISIPFMFSIAEGIGMGLIAFAVLALVRRQPSRLPVAGYIIAAVFFLKLFQIFPF